MCGRYNIIDSPIVQALLEELGIDIGPLPVRYNIAPTENVPVIFRNEEQNALINMRWWLVPSWSDGPSTQYAMFNARCEHLQKSRAFSKPFKSQRCVIPATSFIEWQKAEGGKQPYLIRPIEGVFAFAGVWDYWEPESLYSCSIITTNATSNFKHVHSRMPVMLARGELNSWLNPNSDTNELLYLFEPRLPEPLEVLPVAKSINNARHKEALEEIGEPEIIAYSGEDDRSFRGA